MKNKRIYETNESTEIGFVLRLKSRPVWEAKRGHAPDRSGSGEHDTRPKRKRTRGNRDKHFFEEFE